jgi:hypothetical protein
MRRATMGSSEVRARQANAKKRKVPTRAISHEHDRAEDAETIRNEGAEVGEQPDYWDILRTWQRRPRPVVTAKKGKLVIKLPLIDPPRLSRSGKCHLVACTYGVRQSSLVVEGLPVRVTCTAFICGPTEEPPKFVSMFEVLGIRLRTTTRTTTMMRMRTMTMTMNRPS